MSVHFDKIRKMTYHRSGVSSVAFASLSATFAFLPGRSRRSYGKRKQLFIKDSDTSSIYIGMIKELLLQPVLRRHYPPVGERGKLVEII